MYVLSICYSPIWFNIYIQMWIRHGRWNSLLGPLSGPNQWLPFISRKSRLAIRIDLATCPTTPLAPILVTKVMEVQWVPWQQSNPWLPSLEPKGLFVGVNSHVWYRSYEKRGLFINLFSFFVGLCGENGSGINHVKPEASVIPKNKQVTYISCWYVLCMLSHMIQISQSIRTNFCGKKLTDWRLSW